MIVTSPTHVWLREALDQCHSSLEVSRPYIGRYLTTAVSALDKNVEVTILTRTLLSDFAVGASDFETVCRLASRSGGVLSLNSLHAKVYVIDRTSMRTLKPGRTQVNMLATRKREHSRKPDEIYDIIESCSPGPFLELFARFKRLGWHQWGNEDVEQNSLQNVAQRKGHVDPQMRLLEAPSGYRGGASKKVRTVN